MNDSIHKSKKPKSPLGNRRSAPANPVVIKAIIFDLDGTLLDSVGDITLANNKVLQANGLPTHSIDKYIKFIGNGARKLVQLSLPEELARDEIKVDFFLNEYKNEYLQNSVVKSKLYDGIPELLKFLNKLKIPFAINTNKPQDQTQAIVDQLLSEYRFEKIVGQSDEFPKKPNPSAALKIAEELQLNPNEVLYVGDSDVDAKTALAAEMQLLCVEWGYSSKQEMMDAGCVNFVNTGETLIQYIKTRI